MGDDYENMTKEELIIENERLEIYIEEVNRRIDTITDENKKLHDLLQSIMFLLDNTYDNIRNS